MFAPGRPDRNITSATLWGTGVLYAGDVVLLSDIVYHLSGWPDPAGELHLCGTLRGRERGDLVHVVGALDLALHLEGNWWWNCVVIDRSGWTTTRDGGLHRRP